VEDGEEEEEEEEAREPRSMSGRNSHKNSTKSPADIKHVCGELTTERNLSS